MTSLQRRLKKIDACVEAREWVGKKSLREAWRTCPNGSWMNYWLIEVYPKCRMVFHRIHLRGFARLNRLPQQLLPQQDREAFIADYLRARVTAGGRLKKVKPSVATRERRAANPEPQPPRGDWEMR